MMNLNKRFKEGLKKYNLTTNEIENSDYRQVIKEFLIKSNKEVPPFTDRCVCGHKIEQQCYIHSKKNNNTLVLGNCCVKKFIPKERRGKTCDDCGKHHKNKKVNKCNDCRDWNCSNCGKQCNEGYYKCFDCV